MALSLRDLVRQLTPPILVTAKRSLFNRPSGSASNAEQAALEAAHAALNQGVPEDAICLRPGMLLKLHPESREAFEAFCYRYPEMVIELDTFIARTAGKRHLLDVGALHGIFSLVFCCNDPGRNAVAVDASPIAFARLLYNVHKNRLSNIAPVECAMSAERGSVRMHYEWEHAVAAGTASDASAGVTVETRTGNDLCASLSFDPDVVKIDVEGHEVKVLSGLREVLRRCRPLIFLEVHPDRIREEGDSLAGLAQMLTDLSYRAESASGETVPMASISTFTTDQRLVLTVGERGST